MRTASGRIAAGAFGVLAVLFGGADSLAAGLDTPAGLQDAYQDARGRVVGITYTLKAMESEPGVEGPKADGVLCGVVVDSSGLILTVGDIFPEPGGDPRQTFSPTDFKVHYGEGKTAPATAVGIDRTLNLAYLRIAAETADELRPAKFRENPQLGVGDPVVVIGVLGRKYGFAPAVFRTTINSEVQGKIPLFGVDALLQDLALGGLVLRRDGSAAGIVAKDLIAEDLDDNRSPGNILSILANMGQPQVRRPGYAMVLPYSAFNSSLASPPPMDLAADVKRAWIGIVMQALSSDLRDYWKLPVPGGIIVGSVVENSPAQEAGIRPGDVITAFDGDPLRIAEDAQLSDFRRKVEVMGVGRETDVQVYRDRTPITVRMKLGEAPKTASRAEEYEDEEFGMTVREITIDTQQALNLDPNFRGVVVAETEESGWADIAGLVPDDVILSVNGAKVTSVEEVRASLQEIGKARAPEAVFFVMRPPDTLFLRVKTDFKERLRDGPGGGAD